MNFLIFAVKIQQIQEYIGKEVFYTKRREISNFDQQIEEKAIVFNLDFRQEMVGNELINVIDQLQLQSYQPNINNKHKIKMDNPQELYQQNSQSFRYRLLDMNFDTNFQHLSEAHGKPFQAATLLKVKTLVRQIRHLPKLHLILLRRLILQMDYSAENSIQSTFYTSQQQNNNSEINSLKKNTKKPLLLEFPSFGQQKEKQTVFIPSTVQTKPVTKSKSKFKQIKDIPKKGLREISQQVKQIICNQNGLTYNEVAQFVVNENKETQEAQQKLGKSATVNIKRRVYDVLAVLSSLKLLERDSKKKIFATNQCYKLGVGTCKNKQQLQNLGCQISTVKDSIKEKQKQLRKSLTYYSKLRQLSERNIGLMQLQKSLRQKQIDRYIGRCQDIMVQDIDESLRKMISFPFVYTTVSDGKNICVENSQCVRISDCEKQVNGDLDLVVNLQLPRQPKNQFEQQLQSLLEEAQKKR